MQTDKGDISHSMLRKYWLYVAPLPITLYAALKGWPPKPPEVMTLDEAVELSPDILEKLGQYDFERANS